MIGQTLGHYRVLEQIGAGGMGVVYRAHDQRLDRDVALKVLPPGTLADEAARRRFRNEALALSKLNHPSIETVFDFDSQDGVDFLVMEYIAGQTLGEKLVAGTLAEKEITQVGMQLSEALAAAHAHGVVHRDIKPGNIRITPDGRVKVLDFGLAKLLQPLSPAAATESVSETGLVAGTLPYMAPEQLRGEGVDGRSDIYSLGVVLYELVTGRRPFQETLSTALTDAILHKPAPPPGRLRPELSAELERIILKCLEKDAENRYQSVKELCVDLRRMSVSLPAAATAPRLASARRRRRRIRTLAVLPLENLSADPEHEYFADGMTDALLTHLAQLRALRVISRTSVMRYKGTRKPLPEIARELGVDAVVEGSVLRSGDRVRITAQLVHAPTDEHLWAQSYERDLRDILALQSEVARAIVGEIRVKLTPQEHARLAAVRPQIEPKVYDSYVKGLYYGNQWTPEGFRKAIDHFQQAVAADPTCAPAYAGLAWTYAWLGFWAFLPVKEVHPKARAAALRALELDDTLAQAHAALCLVHWLYDWDLAASQREVKRALQLNPKDAMTHVVYGLFLVVLTQEGSKGLAEVKRAQELDPLSLLVNTVLGWGLLFLREYEQAKQQCRKTLEMYPDALHAYLVLGLACSASGKHDEGVATLQKAVELSRGAVSLSYLARTYALAGHLDEARALLAELKERITHEYVPATRLATVYDSIGDREEAFRWFEKAYQERDPFLFWLKANPFYDPLRADPRFQDLLQRMNLPQ